MLKNSKGKVFYGMHFYPGVAEYQEPDGEPYRVFLNEDTIRSMDPSFAGRPIFVEHVDEVDQDINELRKDADGWVIESFYNAADGKHWVKFIIVSDRGEKAIANGMRLSNAYLPQSFSKGGLWNGVEYAKEVTGGEYEHLAIVKNPRYEESVIMTPEKFKEYNEQKLAELKKLSNSKDQKETSKMKLNIFKRQKVENSVDLEGMSVVLPKSGKEMTITQLVNSADEAAEKEGKPQMANADHLVKIHDGSEMKVGDLVAKHKAMNEELESLKKKKEDEKESQHGLDSDVESVEVEGDKHNDEEDGDEDSSEDKHENEEDEDEKKKEKDSKDAEKKKNELEEKAAKKKAAAEKAEKLRNAHLRDSSEEVARVEFSADQVSRGKARYGSN